MKQTTINYVVAVISFINLLGLAFTGFVMKYILPPGSGGHGFRGGRNPVEAQDLWSMTRHQWGDIHFVLAVLFVALMVTHLTLHWGWIKGCTKSLLSCPQDPDNP